MEAVDGNAIGGLLWEVFGTEMTDAASVCASCGAARLVAELAAVANEVRARIAQT